LLNEISILNQNITFGMDKCNIIKLMYN